jgi:hypothetical protein
VAERRAVEDALAAALAAQGARVLLVPHVYYLDAGHPALERLAAIPGGLVVASWLAPRAAYWTLRAHGLDDPGGAGPDGPGRVRCFDLGAFPTADACAEALVEAGGVPADAPATPPVPEEVAAEVSPRWYPVLDYSRCVACGKCRDFCLFGVYSLADEQVVVSGPDQCKDGCPACARLCPEGAILFPHYAADPVIAGRTPPPAGSQAALLPLPSGGGGGRGVSEPRRPHPNPPPRGEGKATAAAPFDPARAEQERAECAEDRDELDELIDALDDLDE